MLCRSIAEKGLENILTYINGAEMAEIRIEETGLSVAEVKTLFSKHPNLLATCRPVNLNDQERTALLKAAIDGGAKWVDIEIESDNVYTTELVAYAKQKGCKVIISYHNYDETPSLKELNTIVDGCKAKGAELVKLACQVNHVSDNGRLMGLYAFDIPILVLGMGPVGMITRIAALKMGAPFTFVKTPGIQATAPGQLGEAEVKDILNYLK